MRLNDHKALEDASVVGTYARLPLQVVRGAGSWVWDEDDNQYLDLLCGISVTNLGHCHPQVVDAIRDQARTLIHASNLFYTEPGIRLAEKRGREFLNKALQAKRDGAKLPEPPREAEKGGH